MYNKTTNHHDKDGNFGLTVDSPLKIKDGELLVKMVVQVNVVLASFHNHIKIITKLQDNHHLEWLKM